MTRGVIGRRLTLAAPLAVAGCGWHAVYGGGDDGPVAAELSRISVAIIPERTGQLLRLALQERFERFGLAEARIYDLTSSFSIAGEGIGIRQDSTTTRIRLVGTADWKLIGLTPTHPTVTSGTARAVDGLDIINQQLFAADLQVEATERRMADTVAEQITTQLATYFRTRADNVKPA